MTTIVAREKTLAPPSIGAVVGLGHLAILVVGGRNHRLRMGGSPRVGLSMEFSVGVMLIVLGIMNLTGVMRRLGASRLTRGAVHPHTHAHSHGDYVHTHAHAHTIQKRIPRAAGKRR